MVCAVYLRWLREEKLAVAQRQVTHVYDKKGRELHRLTALDNTLRLEFLQHHMLLVASVSNFTKILTTVLSFLPF